MGNPAYLVKKRQKCKLFLTYIFLGAIVWINPCECRGYLLPGEQILGLMTANFSAFKSIVFIKMVLPAGLEKNAVEGKEIQKKIWLKAPGFFRSETISTKADSDLFSRDIEAGAPGHAIYHLLFMARDEKLQKELLSRVGIDLNSVSLEKRQKGIVYRIGSPGGKHPAIVLEKGRFLPLEINFCSKGDGMPAMLSIRFDDYRRLEKGWFPYRISYFRDGEPFGYCTITGLEINPPIHTTLSPISLEDILPAAVCEGRDAYPQEERIDNIIKSLKDKYQ